MTIGFFGDSFGSTLESNDPEYETYIKRLSKHYNAEIVNLGWGGSGVEDLLLVQFKPFVDKCKIPDVCIFLWTNPGRLFNREVRHLNSISVKMEKIDNSGPVWDAARLYYDHLYDNELVMTQYKALLQYVDKTILTTMPQNIKIIHLWSFGKINGGFRQENITVDKISYDYQWTKGVEIRPSLLTLSVKGQDLDMLPRDKRPNHLEGNHKNELVFNWIKTAIDSYQDGKVLNFGID
jgi:hypothetical protein